MSSEERNLENVIDELRKSSMMPRMRQVNTEQ